MTPNDNQKNPWIPYVYGLIAGICLMVIMRMGGKGGNDGGGENPKPKPLDPENFKDRMRLAREAKVKKAAKPKVEKPEPVAQ